jgi:hypothetical protein
MGETTMPIRRYSKEEFSQRGNALYESQIRSQVEADNHGKIVAIDIESGDFEVDEDTLVASDRLLLRHPDAQTWFIRIGHRAVHRLFWHSPLEEWSLSEINASVRDLLDDPEEDIYTLEDGEPIDDVDPTIQSAWVAEAQRRHDEISDGRVQPIDGDQALMETLYLLSIPGMRESIREGMATPIEDCDRLGSIGEDRDVTKSV